MVAQISNWQVALCSVLNTDPITVSQRQGFIRRLGVSLLTGSDQVEPNGQTDAHGEFGFVQTEVTNKACNGIEWE